MESANPAGTQRLSAAVAAILRARITGFNDHPGQASDGSYEDDLTTLISAKFSSSKISMDTLVAFLRTPDDVAIQDSFQRALMEHADSSREFRDQLISTIQPQRPATDPESSTSHGAHNTTTVTHSTVKGRSINLGVLTKSRQTRIGLGLGGLAALALLGGGVSAVALSPSPPNHHAKPNRSNPPVSAANPSDVPSADLPLADGQYIYMGIESQGGTCDAIMFRWTTKDGYGNGSVTDIQNSQTDSLSNAGLAVQGTSSSLEFTITPQLGQQITVHGTTTGNALTVQFPSGSDGETNMTFKQGTLTRWHSMQTSCPAQG